MDRVVVAFAAALLFAAQPLTGKWLLPDFGGAPSVWIACLLVFQITVIIGCLLADHLPRWPQRHARLAITACGGIAIAALIVPGRPLVFTLLDAPLAASLAVLSWAGPAAVLLAATSPLLQSARRETSLDGRDPYRLSAWANGGSLLGLLAYPLLIEANSGRTVQTWLLALGVLALTLHLVRICPHVPSPTRHAGVVAPLPWRCLTLPALGTIMLSGHSQVLCQEIAPVPLLWVVPLAIYLITWILPFAHPRTYHRGIAIVALVVVNLVLVGMQAQAASIDAGPRIVVELLALGLACWCCHSEVAALRPPASDLTRFWIRTAFGGAIGTALVVIVAPLVFNDYSEHRIALILIAAIAAVTPRLARAKPLPWALAGLGVLVLALPLQHLSRRHDGVIHAERTFFGILSVREMSAEGLTRRELRHGATVHGIQVGEPMPSAYYGPTSGLGEVGRRRTPGTPQRIAAVGLGIGTLAAWLESGDDALVIELDPAVTEAALTYFDYLSLNRGNLEVRHGDGRLRLRSEPRVYDLLILDAFSGDAVPTHLLTAEAFRTWSGIVQADGICCIHISNRHFDLAAVVRSSAAQVGWHTLIIDDEPEDTLRCESSTWAICFADADDPRIDSALRGRAAIDDGRRQEWTDDRVDLLRCLRW